MNCCCYTSQTRTDTGKKNEYISDETKINGLPWKELKMFAMKNDSYKDAFFVSRTAVIMISLLFSTI